MTAGGTEGYDFLRDAILEPLVRKLSAQLAREARILRQTLFNCLRVINQRIDRLELMVVDAQLNRADLASLEDRILDRLEERIRSRNLQELAHERLERHFATPASSRTPEDPGVIMVLRPSVHRAVEPLSDTDFENALRRLREDVEPSVVAEDLHLSLDQMQEALREYMANKTLRAGRQSKSALAN